MKKLLQTILTFKLFFLLILFLFGLSATAQTIGIFESYTVVSVNGGANAYYDNAPQTTANPDFQGTVFGPFIVGNSLVIKGGQNKTFKNSGGNVTGGNLYYRVWLTSAGQSGAFTSLPMAFITNLAGAGDQQWEGVAGTTNILAGLAPGDYTIEVYSEATGTPSNVFQSNFGNNFRATFRLCGPATGALPAGNYAIPGCFASIKAAADYINTNGIAGTGNVQFDIAAGFVEPALAANTSISLTATGTSASNQIIFKKFGIGANPLVTAPTWTAGGVADGIFEIVGGDYITIDGLSFAENTANTVITSGTNTMTEFAVGMFLSTATNGAKFNTIQNCTITLNSTYGNSIGVFSSSNCAANNAALVASASTGSNTNNKIYSNTISNVAFGVYFLSPPNTATIIENNNDIGGSSNATSNTITFGSLNPTSGPWANSPTSVSAGIEIRNGIGNSIQYNNVTSNALAYPMSSFGGIQINGTPPTGGTYTSTVSNNNITLTNNGATGSMGIDFGFGIATGTIVASSNTIVINQNFAVAIANTVIIAGILSPYTAAAITTNNNNITINQTSTGSGVVSSPLTGINIGGTTPTNTSNNNTILFNQTTSATLAVTSAVTGISAQTNVSTVLNIGVATLPNTITIKQAITGSGLYGLGPINYVNTTAAAHGTLNIVSNNFNTTGGTIRSIGPLACINTGIATLGAGGLVATNNTVNIDRVAASGTISFFNQTTTTPNTPIDNFSGNTINFTSLAGSTVANGISQLGGGTAAVKTFNNNTINIAGTHTGISKGIVATYSSAATYSGNSITIDCMSNVTTGIEINTTANSITNNTFSLKSGATVPITLYGIHGTATMSGVSNIFLNNFTKLELSGAITGNAGIMSAITVFGGTTNNIYQNIITNITAGATTGSTGGSTVDGLQIGGGTTNNIYTNKIYGINSNCSGTAGVVNGMRLSAGTTNNVYNNNVGGLANATSANTDAIRGIAITSSTAATNQNIFHNTVFLNATTTSATFGSSALFHNGNATATTSALNLRNNIFINKSAFAGASSFNVAFRRNLATQVNYATTSNNNIFYAGTPSANNLIYYDGTNSDQTLATFQTRVATRDAASQTEDVVFVSTAGSSADFLRIASNTLTFAESGAPPITTPNINTDYWSVARPFATPTPAYNAVAGTVDIGASEFDGRPAGVACVAPTAQATAFVGGAKTVSTIAGSFTAASPTATGYLVVRSPIALSANPVDATSYIAGATIGNGTVIQSGATVTFSATALAANTDYIITIFAYNSGSCTGGPKYFVTTPLTGTLTTCPVAPTTAVNSAITETGGTVSWTASAVGGGALPINYTLSVFSDAARTILVGSAYSTGSAVTQNITGLTAPATIYYYRIQASTTSCSATALDGTFTTACTTPNNPGSISVTAPSSIGFTLNYAAATPAPTNYILFFTTGTTATAIPSLVNGTTYVNGTSYTFGGISYGCITNTSVSPTVLTGGTSNTQYNYFLYSKSTTGGCSGAPYYSSGVTVSAITCPAAPTLPVVSAITTTGATLAWTASAVGGGAAAITYTLELHENPAYTAPFVSSPFAMGSSLSQVLTGLSPATTYYYRIKANNGSCDSAFLNGSFTTACNPITTYPSIEPLDTYLPSVCWFEGDAGTNVAGPSTINSTASKWLADDFLNANGTNIGAARVNIFSTTASNWIISPYYTIPATGYQVTYNVGATQFGAITAPTTAWEADDFVELLVSTNNVNWTVLKTYNSTSVPSNLGQLDVLDLSAYSGQTIHFAFKAFEGASNGAADIDFFIDNFTVELIPRPIVITPTSATICSGSSATLTATSAAPYIYTWSPATGLSATTGATVTAAPTANTTYTVTGTNGTETTTKQVVVTVNPIPAAVSITPSSAAVCDGAITTLTASGGASNGTGTIGTSLLLPLAATDDVSAFNNRRLSFFSQTIYTASELTAAGINAGNLTSLSYNINSLGSSATNASYTVKIGTTAGTNFPSTSFFNSASYTTVYGPSTYSHTATGWQLITFATPYVWDGVSNIVVNVTMSGADSTNNAQTYYTNTSDNKTLSWYNNNSATTGTLSTNRMDIRFTYNNPAPITWSPVTNLFTNSLATTAYDPLVNTNLTIVYARPATTTTYTATATLGTCPRSASATITIKPNTTIATQPAASQTVCIGAPVSFNVVAANSATYSYQWKKGTTNVGTDSATYTITNATAADAGTYTVEILGDCGPIVTSANSVLNFKTNVGITNITSTATTICSNATATLTANGVVGTNAVLKWWSGSNGSGTQIGANNDPTITVGPGTYYARVTGDCGAAAEASFTIGTTAVPAFANLQFPSSAAICSGGTIDAFGQVYMAGVTEAAGAGAGITVEFGYSTSASNPNTWTDWATATFITQVGNNDEYKYTFTPPTYTGTYYYTFRYRTSTCDWLYGGFSGGFWNDTTNVSGVLTFKTAVNFASVSVGASPICPSTTTTLTAVGLTGTNAIVTWYSGTGASGTNYGTGTSRSFGPGTYFARATGDCGTAVEFSATVGALVNAGITNITAPSNIICSGATQTLTANGVVGTNAVLKWWTGSNGSGTQIGADNDATITVGIGTYYARVTGDCGAPVQVQYTLFTQAVPTYVALMTPSGTVCQGTSFIAYGQVFQSGITPGAGAQGAGITAEFGYSTTNTDPSTWTTWTAGTFNSAGGGTNNDEYSYDFSPPLGVTYYYTFRFRQSACDWQYAGYSSGSGGIWNGTSNVNGVITTTPAAIAGTASGLQTVCVNREPTNLSLAGFTGTITKWQKSTSPTFASSITDIAASNSATLTGATIGAVAATTYFRAVVNGTCGDVFSNIIPVSVTTTTYSGSTWTNGPPNGNMTIVIDQDFTASADLDGCSCTINSGNTLTISAGVNLILKNEINSTGTTVFENSASLIQTEGNSNANTGNITYKRNAFIKKLDYVYWSSPVANKAVTSIYTGTPVANTLSWLPTAANSNGGQGDWTGISENMIAGKGYAIRVPNSLDPITASTVTTTFVGVPNNGIYTFGISRGSRTGADVVGPNGATITSIDDNWNLIGNPYPSAIDADIFMTANPSIEGSIDIWTHGTSPSTAQAQPFYGTFANNYNANDYITYNTVGAQSGPGALGKIAAGQGFFVKMLETGAATNSVIFNNAMRSASFDNSNFYRTTNDAQGTNDKSRIWLDLVQNSSNTTSRILVGYVPGATQSRDRMFDATADYQSSQSFHSLIDNGIYSIQGRALPFVNTDTVPLGFAVPTAGTYKIGVHAVDGLFANNGQTVYLQDNVTGIVHNLSAAPYSFVTAAGGNKTRFVLRYTSGTLSNNNTDVISHQVLVFKDKTMLKAASLSEQIAGIAVYDVLGRNVFSQNNINANSFETDHVVSQQQALIVKVTLANGVVVTKKIVY